MDKKEFIPLGLIILMFLVGYETSESVPDRMASHWDANGGVNGYSGKTVGLYLLPAVTFFVWILFMIIPKIEVLDFRKNIMDFEKHFLGFKIALTLFLGSLYFVTIGINLGYDISMNHFIIPALAGLFYYIGYILQFIKRNFWIGFRTPWTISNDEVWDKTHALGSKLFRAAGILILAGLLAPEKSIGIILVLVLGASGYVIVYSYVTYRRIVEGKT